MGPLSCCAGLLLGLLWITVTAADSEHPYRNYEANVCKTLVITSRKYAEHRDLKRLYNELYNYAGNCEFVIGDLVIHRLGVNDDTDEPIDENIRKLNTDFLKRIMEISGQLIIDRVNVEKIELQSLSVIRGIKYQSYGRRPHAIDIRHISNPITLYLGILTAISSGDVFITGTIHATLYCYWTKMIDWNELFRKDRWNNGSESNTQKFIVGSYTHVTKDGISVPISDTERIKAMCSTLTKCHSVCHSNKDGRATCWSGDKYHCQNFQYCGSHSCPTCVSIYARGDWTICCDPECVGGCVGSSYACQACQDVMVFVGTTGVCRKDCTFKETQIRGLKQHGNVCVKKCHPPFVSSSDGNRCIEECPESEFKAKGECHKCVSDGQPCKRGDIFINPILTDGLASDIKKNKYSILVTRLFSCLLVDGRWVKSPSSLTALEKLQYLKGDLNITRVDRWMDNLGFLRNLKIVTGFLTIFQVHTRYLGLGKLYYTKALRLTDISGLCSAWFPRNYILNRSNNRDRFPIEQRSVRIDTTSEICRNATCHPLCGSGECWGPGLDMCVAGN